MALVPARYGSESVHHKNLRLIRGVPLVVHTFEAAIKSSYITEVYLSTNDQGVVDCASNFPIKVIRRPDEFCSSVSTANDVIGHFINQLSVDLVKQDPLIVYLQPTSVLRTSFHIDQALSQMIEKGLRKMISVYEMDVSIYKSFKCDGDGLLQAFFEEKLTNQSRQTLPKVFLPNGAIYVFGVDDFLKHGRIPSNGSYPYIMSSIDSIDIDSEDDLTLVEAVTSYRAKQK